MEHDQLAQHLESLKREDCYRVDAVLKQSDHEVTQRVYFVGDNGSETGPFIRKFIKQVPGMGVAYERIFVAQQNGQRFKHVPDVLECYARDGSLVVVLEYVRGETLQEIVYQNNPSVELAKEVFPQLCDAVAELHNEFDPPIIHRDLKPSNIVLSSAGLAVIDFGIAREYKGELESDTTHFGTRGFAPPEQFGFGQTGVYSDVYSLGMVLYYCLAEEIPDARMQKREFKNPLIPESLRRVIIKATALDPAMRYACVEDLKQAFLDAAADGGAVPVPQCSADDNATANVQPETVKRANRKPVAIAVAVAVLVIAVGIGVANMFGANSPQQVIDANSLSSSPASADATAVDASATSVSSRNDDERAPSEADVTERIEIASASKDGFDPLTNFSVEVAGVQFQVPSYFKMNVESPNATTVYFRAETGSSVVMLMMKESHIDLAESEEVPASWRDDYLSGLLSSGATFQELVTYTDCELAGYSARIAAIRGNIDGMPVTTKVAYFFNPNLNTVGLLAFGQTQNAQYDYSSDFAKTVTSAQKVASS